MSEEICKCGHSREGHLEFKDGLDEKMNRPYRILLGKGRGKCIYCDCSEFKKKG